MADLRKMTVEGLRELARKVLGPGQSRLKTKGDLVAALEAAAKAPARPAPAKAAAKVPARPSATAKGRAAVRAAKPSAPDEPARAGKASRAAAAAKAVKTAGKAARAGVQAAARAGKAAAAGVAEAAGSLREAVKPAARKKPSRLAAAAAAVAGAAGELAAAARAAGRAQRAAKEPAGGPADPAGFFVARVRGEDAVREAPHPMTETAESASPERSEEDAPPLPGGGYDERLGELPWGYGDDAFVALPRDPRTLFVYWDLSGETVRAGFDGLDHPRAQLRIYARAGEGWEPVRTLEFALESRGYYVHELEPGRIYRAEIHAVDRRGADRPLGRGSNEMMLPPLGPSPVIDDRFIRIPWDLPLGRLLGPGHAGGPFSDEARALLARLSDWSRFAIRGGGGGSAGGIGGRSGASWPTSPAPSSPGGPFGGREDA